MRETPTADSSLVERLRTALADIPGVRLAVLFGSAVSGKRRLDSDLDVAILTSASDLTADRDLAVIQALSSPAQSEVDLVRLETASTLLKWQIATRGVVLFEERPGEFARFQARTASEYLDYAPALAHCAEVFRRRVAQGLARQ